MSKKLFAATASALVMMAAAGAQARDADHYNHSYNSNASIQKGQSASVKGYGYNKQGDHYSANNRDSRWNERYVYPGQRVAFGTKSDLVIQKGGSAISDSSVNAQADVRPYGTYWR